MGGRFTVLTDDRLEEFRAIVHTRLRELAARVMTGAFEEFFDAAMRALLVERFAAMGAHEGTVWLLDETHEFLVPRYNSGAQAGSFVGEFKQSIRTGMIGMVVSTELPLCENEMDKNQQQDKGLDRKLGVQTCAMLATPFYFAGELRGVLSAVQLRTAGSSEPAPLGFLPQHLEALQGTAGVLARLIERELLALATGFEDSL